MVTTAFTSPIRNQGSNRTAIGVSRDGRHFGQIWTFRAKGERHGYHAKTLDGAYRLFDTGNKKIDLVDAQIWIAAQ